MYSETPYSWDAYSASDSGSFASRNFSPIEIEQASGVGLSIRSGLFGSLEIDQAAGFGQSIVSGAPGTLGSFGFVSSFSVGLSLRSATVTPLEIEQASGVGLSIRSASFGSLEIDQAAGVGGLLRSGIYGSLGIEQAAGLGQYAIRGDYALLEIEQAAGQALSLNSSTPAILEIVQSVAAGQSLRSATVQALEIDQTSGVGQFGLTGDFGTIEIEQAFFTGSTGIVRSFETIETPGAYADGVGVLVNLFEQHFPDQTYAQSSAIASAIVTSLVQPVEYGIGIRGSQPTYLQYVVAQDTGLGIAARIGQIAELPLELTAIAGQSINQVNAELIIVETAEGYHSVAISRLFETVEIVQPQLAADLFGFVEFQDCAPVLSAVGVSVADIVLKTLEVSAVSVQHVSLAAGISSVVELENSGILHSTLAQVQAGTLDLSQTHANALAVFAGSPQSVEIPTSNMYGAGVAARSFAIVGIGLDVAAGQVVYNPQILEVAQSTAAMEHIATFGSTLHPSSNVQDFSVYPVSQAARQSWIYVATDTDTVFYALETDLPFVATDTDTVFFALETDLPFVATDTDTVFFAQDLR